MDHEAVRVLSDWRWVVEVAIAFALVVASSVLYYLAWRTVRHAFGSFLFWEEDE
jgi:hypothetical protein